MPGWPSPSRRALPRLRIEVESLIVPIAALGLAVICASALAIKPELGVAMILALCFVPLALLRLPLAMSAWALLLFFSRTSALDAVTNRILLFIAVCWIGLLLGRRASLREAFEGNQMVAVLVGLFVAWLILSVAWAPDPAAAERPVKELLYAALGFLLVLGAINEREDVRWLMLAFVAGAALTVLWGASKGGLDLGAGAARSEVNDLEGRFQGGVGDPNYLAGVLVPAIMLVGGVAIRKGFARRALLAVATIVIAAGIAATQSRGGLIASFGCSVVALLIWRGRRALILVLLLLAAAAVVGYFISDPSALHRVQESNHGSGRLDIWTVAWRIVQGHPIFGVGLAQFPQVSPHYVLQPGVLEYAELIIEKHIVVHNAYLQLWAEDGIVGLSLFVAATLSSLAAGWRAVRLFSVLGDDEMASMARTTILALLGILIASFFLSDLEVGQLWVLLALGPVMWKIANRQAHSVAQLAPPLDFDRRLLAAGAV